MSAALQHSPSPAIAIRVLPQCIFAPGRQQFDCLVIGVETLTAAKAAIFLDLPLEEYGWHFATTKVRRINTQVGEILCSVERNSVSHGLHPGEPLAAGLPRPSNAVRGPSTDKRGG